MTDEELQFHYFKLHDYDNNNMLDGTELISAMTHYHHGKFRVMYFSWVITIISDCKYSMASFI